MNHDQIALIQNTVWNIYKTFRENKDMSEVNKGFESLREVVYGMSEPVMVTFFEDLALTYTIIINKIKEWN